MQDWSGLPPELTPPIPVINEALFGYVLDTETSPSSLVTQQIHAGHLAANGALPEADRERVNNL